MRRLSFIQPILTKYREPFFKELTGFFDLRVYAGKPSISFGDFSKSDFIELEWKGFSVFYYCKYSVCRRCLLESDDIVHFADFKCLSLWYLLIMSFVENKGFWLHGQGGYKKQGLLSDFIYTLALFFSKGYISYNEFSADFLKKKTPNFLHKKISIVNNTLYMTPVDKVEDNYSLDLLYIGRIRENSGIEFLLKAAKEANVVVNVIGDSDGDYLKVLQTSYDNGFFFGSIFDREEQLAIAKKCMAGVYGGDAGLSVVHYMAFGLPVIVHGSTKDHMGPEPFYVEDHINGLLFERNNLSSLVEKIEVLKRDKVLRSSLANASLKKFQELSCPAMHEQLKTIIESHK